MSDLLQQVLDDLHTANRLLNDLSENYPLNCDAQANELAGVLSRAIICLVGDRDRATAAEAALEAARKSCGEQVSAHLRTITALAAMTAERDRLLELTAMLDEHPEDYDGPCLCRLCVSYGD